MIRTAAFSLLLALMASPAAAQSQLPYAAQQALDAYDEPAALAAGPLGDTLCILILSRASRFYSDYGDWDAVETIQPDLERFTASLDGYIRAGELTAAEAQSEAARLVGLQEGDYWYLRDLDLCSSSDRWPGNYAPY